MNKIREENSVLDEEHRNIVSNNVYQTQNMAAKHLESHTKIALICVESSRESMNIPRGISAASRASHSGESDKDWGFSSFYSKKLRSRDVAVIIVACKDAMCAWEDIRESCRYVKNDLPAPRAWTARSGTCKFSRLSDLWHRFLGISS
jgi:hypothetical protein